jgi:hypothetical protein
VAETKKKFTESGMTMQERDAHGTLVAKKDFEINHNEYHRVIKVGDDLSDVPDLYHENLRTEGVI